VLDTVDIKKTLVFIDETGINLASDKRFHGQKRKVEKESTQSVPGNKENIT